MGAVTGLLMGQKMPSQSVIQPLPPPSRSDSDVQEAALQARNRKRALLGRAGTIATSDTGVEGAAPVSRSILGGRQAAGA